MSRRVKEVIVISGMVIGAFAVFVGVMTLIAYGSTNQSPETVQKISELKLLLRIQQRTLTKHI